MPLRIGTRGSQLALFQAEKVRAMLEAKGFSSQVVPIVTAGDKGVLEHPPDLAVKGLYTKEIEDRLFSGDIDLAVHSLKDLAVVLPEGLVLGACPDRADPRDALVSRLRCDLAGLPAGSRIGTSSIRRRAAILSHRDDLNVVEMRGNVPTRLRKVEEGEVDAVVLALAGLERLQMNRDAVALEIETVVPAPGQGAIAIEIREGDTEVAVCVDEIDRPEIRVAVAAERAALERLEGGCRAPIGAVTTNNSQGDMEMLVRVYAEDGSRFLTARGLVDSGDPRASGFALAEELLNQGAADLIP